MSPKSKIRICIADDHQLFRTGMRRLVETFDRVGYINEASNGYELLEILKKEKCDVVLLDIRMPIMDGKSACDELRRRYPDIKIIMLTMQTSPHWVDLLMRAGANSFLSKDIDADELEEAIASVVDRGFYYNKSTVEALQRVRSSEFQPGERIADLSAREIEILQLICGQYTTKEISKTLHISEKTVENHRANIMRKIDVKNTAGLVMYAIRHELAE